MVTSFQLVGSWHHHFCSRHKFGGVLLWTLLKLLWFWYLLLIFWDILFLFTKLASFDIFYWFWKKFVTFNDFLYRLHVFMKCTFNRLIFCELFLKLNFKSVGNFIYFLLFLHCDEFKWGEWQLNRFGTCRLVLLKVRLKKKNLKMLYLLRIL